MIVPDRTNFESSASAESQTEMESDGEAIPVKELYTEGIFCRPTVSMQKPKVRKKQRLRNKILAKLNEPAITNQAVKALSPKASSQKKSLSGRVIKPGKKLKKLRVTKAYKQFLTPNLSLFLNFHLQ